MLGRQFVLDDFKKDIESHVYISPDSNSQKFDYSDGKAVELYIYNVIKGAEDRSLFSKELIGSIKDWPTKYHFSPLRHNLIRHINFTKSDKILELGCGCGAITRQLGETEASVTAVDGSFNRATCAAERCRDLPNVKVIASNFQNIKFDETYDFVILIGVLEYSPKFFHHEQPFNACLNLVKSALKKGGKLIVAIENRLGLKYFMGLNEDHIGKPYIGIQDLYQAESVKTFGRVELKNLLNHNGFNRCEFQYPFPDYKLPQVIFMEDAFSSGVFQPAEIIRQLDSRGYYKNDKLNFSEYLTWPMIDKNKLIPELSNSFLVISSCEKYKDDKPGAMLAAMYNNNRRDIYNTKTVFQNEDDMNIEVIKTKLIPSDNYSENSFLKHKLDKQTYSKGRLLESEIIIAIRRDDFNLFSMHLNNWIKFIMGNGISDLKENIFDSTLCPDFIDCLPRNIILTDGDGDSDDDGGLVYIDREWEYFEDFTIYFLIYKFYSVILSKYTAFLNAHLLGEEEPVKKLLLHLKIPYKHIEDERYSAISNKINRIVFDIKGKKKPPKRIKKKKAYWRTFLKNIVPPFVKESLGETNGNE